MARILEAYYKQADNSGLRPERYYANFLKWMGDQRCIEARLVYFTTAMTSGGFIGILNDYTTAFQRNCEVGARVIDYLIGEKFIDPKLHLIYPPDIGKIDGWGQKEFNFFWFLMMSGISASDADLLAKNVRPPEQMADKSLPNEVRWPMYSQYGRDLANFVSKNRMNTNHPIKQCLCIDPTSLGSRLEQQTSRHYGIPVSQLRRGRKPVDPCLQGDLDLLAFNNRGVMLIDDDVTFALINYD